MFRVRDNADGQPCYVWWGKEIHSFKFVKGWLSIFKQISIWLTSFDLKAVDKQFESVCCPVLSYAQFSVMLRST